MNPELYETLLKSTIRYVHEKKMSLYAELRSVNKYHAELETLWMELKESVNQSEHKTIEDLETEIQWDEEVFKIMGQCKAPMTKAMIADELSRTFSFHRRSAMGAISMVIFRHKNEKIKVVKQGWYQLRRSQK